MKQAQRRAAQHKAVSVQRRYSANPFQLLQHKSAVENPFQILKTDIGLQPKGNPMQVIAGKTELQRQGDNAAKKDLPVQAKTIQRLIAVNPHSSHGEPHEDYAIMKVVQQLRKFKKDKIIMLDGAADFSTMAQGETLYIASHGVSDTGQLASLNHDVLINKLTVGARKAPAHISGIVLLSCYGGEVREGQDQSLAQKLAAGLTTGGKTVEGANGFSFGTPNLAETGRSNVLSSDNIAFYKADDIDAMAARWETLMPAGAGVLAGRLGLDYVNPGITTLNNIRNGKNISEGAARGYIKTLMTHFKSVSRGIESQLTATLALIPGASLIEKIESLESATPNHNKPVYKLKVRWEKLIQQQFNLFNDYYLWTGSEEAFSVHRS